MTTNNGASALSKACDEFIEACVRNGVPVGSGLQHLADELRARVDSGVDVVIDIQKNGKAA